MPGTSEHTPKGRLLGAELRDLRKNARLTVRDLAVRLGTSHVTISRYETGARTPRPEDVARVLGSLGVTGNKYEELVEFARTAGVKNTFARSSADSHKHLVELAEFERSAQNIVDVAPNVLPGLLQTADYARAVMPGLRMPEREIRVGLRMARRDILTGRSPRQLTAIIAENALRQPLGGCAVMAEQLRHVLTLSRRDNVSVFIIPNGLTHSTPAHDGAFVLFEFAKASPIVQLEHYCASAFLYEAKDIDAYKRAVAELHTIALPSGNSNDLIASIAAEMEEADR